MSLEPVILNKVTQISNLGNQSGWKADSVGTYFNILGGITNQDLLSVTPPAGKIVRITALFQPANSGTLTNISVIFGARTVVSPSSIQPAYTTSAAFDYSVGGSANSSTRYLEGKVDEVLVVHKGPIDQNVYLAIGYEIGGYE